MALQTEYTIPITQEVFENAYLKIQKISMSNIDYETYTHSDEPNIESIVTWSKRIETNVIVYVWSDAEARKNLARIVSHFSFDFDFDVESSDNIFTQIYKYLYEKFPNSINV